MTLLAGTQMVQRYRCRKVAIVGPWKRVPPPRRHLCTLCDDQVQAECKVVCHNKLCVTAGSNPCSYVYVYGVPEASEAVSDGVRWCPSVRRHLGHNYTSNGVRVSEVCPKCPRTCVRWCPRTCVRSVRRHVSEVSEVSDQGSVRG